MEKLLTCEDMGYKFIQELIDFAHQKKTTEEILHFVNVNFEFIFGATAILFIHKEFSKGPAVKSSRGLSHEYVKKINNDPPEHLFEALDKTKWASIYINFEKEPEKLNLYKMEHDNVKQFYANTLLTAINNNSYIVIVYSVNGFKNCGPNTQDIFDTIFSVLSFIINSNNCIRAISDRSSIDYISGLYNFKNFHQKLFSEIQKIIIEKGTLSVVLISINQLNEYNSVFGHIAGDKNIYLIGNIIKKHIRAFDTAARYGNKIAICFPNLNKIDTKSIMEKIFLEIETALKSENNNILSMNAGIAEYPLEENNQKTIIDLAESRRIEARRTLKWAIN